MREIRKMLQCYETCCGLSTIELAMMVKICTFAQNN